MLGRSLKHYRVEEQIGKGGMGVVYRARDTRLDRPVALKVLAEELTSDPERRRRFLREARAASAVNHPSLAQIYDVDEADGTTFIAMEFVEGQTVRELVVGRELDTLGAVEIALQVSGGLGRAHEAGIVHRDIKAENVMVTRDGHAKILDFGLAKLLETPAEGLDSSGEASAMETLARTRLGVVMGTVAYMSPEQARGQPVDHRSDIFSLGILLYEMVTGKLPFSGSTPLDTMHAIAFDETRPVTALRANLPPSLQRVVNRCLRKRPDDRYPDTRGLVSDLESVKREIETGISQSVPLGERLRDGLHSLRELTPAEWFWPAAALVGLAGVMALLVWQGAGLLSNLALLGFLGLIVWRRIRNRRIRLLKRFTAKVRRMSEVRLVTVRDSQVTVVADRALARTYVRVNALMDRINGKMFFGDPFTVSVRDDLSREEMRGLLTGPGVVYVRRDVVEGPEGTDRDTAA